MKRFLVFSGSSYYARGGWLDFKGAFASVAEAEAWTAANVEKPEVDYSQEWWQVVDAESGLIVAGQDGSYSGNLGDLPFDPLKN